MNNVSRLLDYSKHIIQKTIVKEEFCPKFFDPWRHKQVSTQMCEVDSFLSLDQIPNKKTLVNVTIF